MHVCGVFITKPEKKKKKKTVRDILCTLCDKEPSTSFTGMQSLTGFA